MKKEKEKKNLPWCQHRMLESHQFASVEDSAFVQGPSQVIPWLTCEPFSAS
jgi:hypothetical protein